MPDYCRDDEHDWREIYYGYECTACGLFIPFGCEPWAPDEDEVADMVRDAFDEVREQSRLERAGERLESGLMEFRCRRANDDA
jgi:hypothetical protein